MRLYLMRHGNAAPKSMDGERHLTAGGRAQAAAVASLLKPLKIEVSAVFHSGKTRAAETAAIVADAVRAPRPPQARQRMAPDDPIGPLRDDLAWSENDVLIVGHMPFLERLAGALLAGDEDSGILAFSEAGLACLEGGGDDWRLAWFISPEILPRAKG